MRNLAVLEMTQDVVEFLKIVVAGAEDGLITIIYK